MGEKLLEWQEREKNVNVEQRKNGGADM